MEPDLLTPDHHCWIVAPKYELGSKEFGYIWADFNAQGILQWADPRHGGRRSFDARGGFMFIEFPWGSFVKVVSADNPTGLRAEELDTLILAEASALLSDVYHRHLYARTAKRGGKTIVPTTPMGKNWIYDAFRVPSRETDSNGQPNPLYDADFWSCVVSADPDFVDPTDWDKADIYEPNVHTEETVIRAKKRLPPPIFAEQFGGGFASYAGRVLPYDPRIHCIAPFSIPDHWTHVIGWDHGSSPSETAILIGSYDSTGVLYWWAELYTSGWTVKQYWEWVKRTLGPNKNVTMVAVDPSAKQVRIELANLGVATNIPHDKQIEAGIIRLTQLMNLGQMKVFQDACPNFEREMFRMEWDEKNPKKILKDHIYHACSAARYISLITVQYPVEPEGPIITADLRVNPRLYWKQVNKQKGVEYWKKMDERFKKQDRIEAMDALEDTLVPDILDTSRGGPNESFVNEEFDVESYFED